MPVNLSLEDVCKSLSIAAAVLDTSGTVLYANPATKLLCERVTGGCPWAELLTEPSRAVARQALSDVARRTVDVEHVVARVSSWDADVKWTLIAVGGDNRGADAVLALGQRLTTASFEARQLQDLRYAIDQSAIVAITDQKGVIQHVNDTFCRISKYRREELLGQDHRILNSGLHPPDYIRNLWRTIAQGGVWRGELRNLAKDGSHYWVDTTIVPFLDDAGKPYQYMAIRYDITERKRAQRRLSQQRTLARLGEMAAIIAHEVKNPLAGISGTLQVIARRFDEDSMERQILQETMDRLHDLGGSLSNLLTFARPRPLHTGDVDVAELVQDTVRLVEADPAFAGATVEVETDDVSAEADAQLLREAFLNLAINGLQAAGDGGTLSIALRRRGDQYEVTFADDGPGVPAAERDRIFEPFFSTKARGTGLGLATVRRTVEQHGGTVDFECPSGGGTLFTLVLPLRLDDLLTSSSTAAAFAPG